jgi:hypothetical protein
VGKRPTWKTGICVGNNIKINLQVIVWEGVDWIGLVEGRERCQDLITSVIDIC